MHFADVRDVVRRDLGTELGVADDTDELFDVDGGELRLFDETLGDDDGVFVVGAAPAHECDARRSGRGRAGRGRTMELSASTSPFLTLSPSTTRWALDEMQSSVGLREALEVVLLLLALPY